MSELNMVNEQKIKEIFSDEVFVESLANMETAEDVQATLAEKGIELTVADINALRVQLSNGEEELSEEDLENVSGGVAIALLFSICGALFATGTLVNNVTNRRW